MRYAVLAFLVLGVLGIGVAVDWSSPSRAPVPAIKLQAAPPLGASGPTGPRVSVKRPYGGRDLSRIALPKLERPAPRVERQAPAPRSSSAGPTDSSASGREAPAAVSDRDVDREEDTTTDRTRPTAPTTPETSGTGAVPAPATTPAPAGAPTSDEEEDDDDDDDDGGGGDDDGDDD